MNAIDALVQMGTAAMTLLGQLAGVTADEVIARGGEADTVKAHFKLVNVYYGTTGSKKQQRLAREAAVRNNHGMDRLKHIENYVAKVHNKADKWPLRRRLNEFSGHTKDFRRYARTEVERLNGPADEVPTKRNYSVTRHAGTTDATMSVRGTQAEITEIDAIIRRWADDNDMAVDAAAVRALRDGGGEMIYGAKVLIPFDVGMALLNGEGNDAVLATTAGALITGHELMGMKLDWMAEFVGLTNVDGPISLSTGRLNDCDEPITTREALDRLRHAQWADASAAGSAPNDSAGGMADGAEGHKTPADAIEVALRRSPTAKQRSLLEASQIMCGGEDCAVPAWRCETNHNVPHSRGGLTVMRNLSLLCPFHNGQAGAVETYRNAHGEVHRILPDGRLVRNQHPVARRAPIRSLYDDSDGSGDSSGSGDSPAEPTPLEATAVPP